MMYRKLSNEEALKLIEGKSFEKEGPRSSYIIYGFSKEPEGELIGMFGMYRFTLVGRPYAWFIPLGNFTARDWVSIKPLFKKFTETEKIIYAKVDKNFQGAINIMKHFGFKLREFEPGLRVYKWQK